MSYFNFQVNSTGKQYSVDFIVYSNQYKIAGLGYTVLPVTEEALDGATVFDTADAWATGNATLFAASPAAQTDTGNPSTETQ